MREPEALPNAHLQSQYWYHIPIWAKSAFITWSTTWAPSLNLDLYGLILSLYTPYFHIYNNTYLRLHLPNSLQNQAKRSMYFLNIVYAIIYKQDSDNKEFTHEEQIYSIVYLPMLLQADLWEVKMPKQM